MKGQVLESHEGARSARKPEVEPLEAVNLARGDVLLVSDALLVRHPLPDLLLLRVLRVGAGDCEGVSGGARSRGKASRRTWWPK